MSGYKQCPNGHYYEGDHCPYCPREYASMDELDFFANTRLADQIMTIPLCRHCGSPLRRGIPHPPHGIVVSSINDIRDHIVPWNYLWDGRCEHCGYDYNVRMRVATGSTSIDNHCKYTTIKCAEHEVPHHITANLGERMATVFSGVEIESWIDNGQHDKVFLSAKELQYIFKALQGSLILEQHDYMMSDLKLIDNRT